eukprot:NODE_3069_length_497_cov_27.986607_g2658_i0.p4 GENE.NODE_3069_length_497_cov_27.986607_g2658_i0~~NODE_3069_length_497_cov_27.986607_g2658_i0.p4  ORF type:complete len:51 (-),score=4.80 NODE_3069_length_497_cov_27.986607_g2658_i0:171-323(-)
MRSAVGHLGGRYIAGRRNWRKRICLRVVSFWRYSNEAIVGVVVVDVNATG